MDIKYNHHTNMTINHRHYRYKKEYEMMSRHFKSGMIMGWNKFCFTGGILEVSLKMPGRADVGGLWPAAWMLGNLGRATYESSNNKMWPWSECLSIIGWILLGYISILWLSYSILNSPWPYVVLPHT